LYSTRLTFVSRRRSPAVRCRPPLSPSPPHRGRARPDNPPSYERQVQRRSRSASPSRIRVIRRSRSGSSPGQRREREQFNRQRGGAGGGGRRPSPKSPVRQRSRSPRSRSRSRSRSPTRGNNRQRHQADVRGDRDSSRDSRRPVVVERSPARHAVGPEPTPEEVTWILDCLFPHL
jgi:hypothetical protein